MRPNIAANQIIDSFLGRPYFLGDPQKGLDCLNSILIYYESLGYKFPDEFEGVTRENYAEKWRKDEEKTRGTLGRFLMSLGRPIEKGFFQRDDLLLFRAKEIPIFGQIYLGGGNMGIVWKQGFYQTPFRVFERWFIGARRLIG